MDGPVRVHNLVKQQSLVIDITVAYKLECLASLTVLGAYLPLTHGQAQKACRGRRGRVSDHRKGTPATTHTASTA